MNNKLVTLIGGGGFLGRYVAQALLERGARVRIAQRDPRQAFFLKTQGGLGQTQFVAVDITKPESIARVVADADAVVNLVGILAGDFQKIQVDGARIVAEAAAHARVATLIHMSAIGADSASDSAYGRSKGEGEAAVRAAFPAVTILRPSIVFGREDQFLNRFAAMIGSAPIVPVLRTGTKFQPVYVGDVAQAVVQAIAGKTFELGGPDTITMGALVRWIAKTTGHKRRIVDLPDAIGAAIAGLGFLPGAPITKDQWRMLAHDNVVAQGANGLEALSITPTPLDAVAPNWLVRYRKGGRFSMAAAA
jgi:NADH dehydrogenase